ncbi:MAG: hypothetical protein ACI30J_06770, partial [Paludibacteraceae bacterium]
MSSDRTNPCRAAALQGCSKRLHKKKKCLFNCRIFGRGIYIKTTMVLLFQQKFSKIIQIFFFLNI